MVSACPPIVTVPLRAAPVLADTDTFTVPLPVPDAPSAMTIQLAVVAAVHAHPAPAVTAAVPVPPAACRSIDAGAIENVQGLALCITVNDWPAIVAVPVLAAPALVATFTVTAPDPLPAPLPAMVIHEARLADVQAHDGPVVTATVDLPPAAGCESVAGL